MRAVWYIQILDNDRDIYTQNLIYAAREQGFNVYTGKYIPFDVEQDLTFLPSDRPVVFHGSIGCARSVQRRALPLRPFAWFDFDKLCCHGYYAHWGEHLAVKHYGLYPLGELRRLKGWLYNVYSLDDKIFVRPDTNDKVFTGEVVARDQFERFMNWVWVEDNMADVICVVGTPTEFAFEYRLVVADGKVVAGSQYRDGACFCVDRHVPDGAARFAEEVANVWSPHPIYVLDVGLTPGGYRVIECGSANCAGFYQCELRPVVAAMSAIAEREFNAKQEVAGP